MLMVSACDCENETREIRKNIDKNDLFIMICQELDAKNPDFSYRNKKFYKYDKNTLIV